MKFYNALQMDPSILKRKIAACDTRQEKAYYWTAIAVRSLLIVAFAIVFISLLSNLFGSDNTLLAVALFCMWAIRSSPWRRCWRFWCWRPASRRCFRRRCCSCCILRPFSPWLP